MTTHIQIPDVTPVIRFLANGTQNIFSYSFPIFTIDDLKVYIDGTLQNSGYTITGAGQTEGGNVVFTIAPASGQVVSLKRQLKIQRTTDFLEGGDFSANVINTELDYLVAGLQQLENENSAVLRFSDSENLPPITTLPLLSERANHALGFDSAGNPVAYPVNDITPPPAVNVTVSGGSARTINSRANDAVSVKDFGAVGNGLADDTNAFNAALAAHGYVFVPKGVYLISGTITLQAGQALTGVGASSVIRALASNFTVFEVVAGNTKIDNVKIEQAQLAFKLYGREGACTNNTLSNIIIDQCISGIELDGFTNSLRPCQSNHFTGIAIQKFTGDGIKLVTSGAGLAPSRNNFENICLDPQGQAVTGNAIFVQSGIEQNCFSRISADITTPSTACIRIASGVSGTRLEGVRVNAHASAAHIRLESGSLNTVIEDLQALGAGTVIDDLSSGQYTARNAGAVDKNKLLRTNISDLTAQTMRYTPQNYALSGIVVANAAYSLHLVSAAAGAVTFQLPNATSVSGCYMVVKKSDTSLNAVTITDHAGAQIETRDLILSSRIDSVTLFSNGVSWHVISSPAVSRGMRTVTFSSGTYDIDMLADTYVITNNGNMTTRLPTPSATNAIGRTITIKKISVATQTMNITVLGGTTLDNGAAITLNGDNSAITVISDGVRWRILSRYN